MSIAQELQSFRLQVQQSFLAVEGQATAIEEIALRFLGAKVARRTNKSLCVRFETRAQATQFGAACNADGWSVQIQKGLKSTQFYALVYFQYPY